MAQPATALPLEIVSPELVLSIRAWPRTYGDFSPILMTRSRDPGRSLRWIPRSRHCFSRSDDPGSSADEEVAAARRRLTSVQNSSRPRGEASVCYSCLGYGGVERHRPLRSRPGRPVIDWAQDSDFACIYLAGEETPGVGRRSAKPRQAPQIGLQVALLASVPFSNYAANDGSRSRLKAMSPESATALAFAKSPRTRELRCRTSRQVRSS